MPLSRAKPASNHDLCRYADDVTLLDPNQLPVKKRWTLTLLVNKYNSTWWRLAQLLLHLPVYRTSSVVRVRVSVVRVGVQCKQPAGAAAW